MVFNESLQLAPVRVSSLVCGALELETSADGWIVPRRFLPAQLHALTSCMAWHPGLFRQMAHATSGVCLRFATDANEIALAVRVEPEPSGTAAVLNRIPQRAEANRHARKEARDSQMVYDLRDHSVARGPYDGFSVVVDGRLLGVSFPRFDVLHVSLRDPDDGLDEGVVALPGLGRRHEVTIWLPCLRGCAVRELWSNGTYVEAPERRPRLLVFGDSVGQGFCGGDPARNWAASLSARMQCELVNQSLCGQVFQPTVLLDASIDNVEHIVVALGLQYHAERCSPTVAAQDMRGFLTETTQRWPEAHVWVVTPTWYNEKDAPPREGSCYEHVARLLQEAAGRSGATVIDGMKLMDHDVDLLADGIEHPVLEGHEQIAQRLFEVLGNGVTDPQVSEAGFRETEDEEETVEVVARKDDEEGYEEGGAEKNGSADEPLVSDASKGDAVTDPRQQDDTQGFVSQRAKQAKGQRKRRRRT